MTENELFEELLEDLKNELSQNTSFDEDTLKIKLKQAMREVKAARRYPMSYTQEQIEYDLNAYYPQIRNIALYDYNQVGVSFQSTHNENDTDRTWVDRNSLFGGILPLAKC